MILRSLGIEECEPKVILQLLEFVHKYSIDIIEDAKLYASYSNREVISAKDIKLALQTKVGKYFLPAPPRSFLQHNANVVNSKPLSVPDTETLLRIPNFNGGLFGPMYVIEQKDGSVKKKGK